MATNGMAMTRLPNMIFSNSSSFEHIEDDDSFMYKHNVTLIAANLVY